MKFSINRNVGDIKRNYLASINVVRIVTWWAFIAVIFFGYFGIRPLSKVLVNKNNTVKEMIEINKNLESNIALLNEEGAKIESTGNNLNYLYTFMPVRPNIQDYLVEMLPEISKAGFTVKKYVPSFSSVEGEYPITVLFEGTGDITMLIEKIESLKRITRVESFKVLKNDNSDSIQVNANLIIYYFETKAPVGVLMGQ